MIYVLCILLNHPNSEATHNSKITGAYCACRVYPFFKCRNVGLSGIQSVRYQNEQKCRYWNQSDTGRRGPSPVQECSGTGLRYRMPECIQRSLQKMFFSPSAVDGAVRDIEEAPYIVLAEHEGWEEREFPATKWVSTEASDSSPHDGPEHRKVIRLLFFINKLFQNK